MLRRKRRRLAPTPDANQRSEDNGEILDTFNDEDIHDAVMDDTLAAINVLLGRYHAYFTSMNLPSLVLWHQIYSIVPNRTAVDKNIYRMRNEGTITTICIPLPGPSVTAILLTTDYVAFMLQCSNKHNATRIFSKVLGNLAKSLTVSKQAIFTAIDELFESKKRPPPPRSILEQNLTYLVQSGYLVGTTDLQFQLYSFSLPRIGFFVNSLAKARAAITALLKRSQFKEMMEVDMKKRKLTCSSLPMDYHLLDMEGVHLIRRIPSSQSFVVCLPDSTRDDS